MQENMCDRLRETRASDRAQVTQPNPHIMLTYLFSSHDGNEMVGTRYLISIVGIYMYISAAVTIPRSTGSTGRLNST